MTHIGDVNNRMTIQQDRVPVNSSLSPKVSRWSNRFIFAAIIQGAIITVLTIPIVWPSGGLFGITVTPAVAQVIASGSAGTWFLVGYVMYITVGVVGVGLTALFYHHFEVSLGKPFKGAISNALGWIHLVLMNVGAGVASSILMYGGYFGERGLMPTSEGGLAQTAGWVHVNILSGLVDPAGYALIVTGIGVLAGGLGFLINYLRK
jgi:hypothetical protein